MIRIGVISEPPPMPVTPTSTPTPNPKTTISGSTPAPRLSVQPALDLVGPRPASVTPPCRRRAVRATYRRVAAVVEGVVGDVVAGDVVPHVALAPVRERVRLPQAVLVVPVELGGVGPAGGLLAPQAGDPCVHPRESLLHRADLADVAAGVGVAVPELVAVHLGLALEAHALVHVDLDAVALLDRLPGVVGLLEQHAGVEDEEARLRLDLHEHVEDHRRLLLEGARHVQARVEAIDHVAEQLLGRPSLEVWLDDGGHGQTAHSPSPRTTLYGSLRLQSTKCWRLSRLNSIGIASSFTASWNGSAPTRSTNLSNGSPSSRSDSYSRIQRSTASGTRLAGRRTLRRVP